MFMRSSRPGRVALVISAAALTFGVAACGSDDDGGDAASATTVAAAPTTAAAAPTTGATDVTTAGSGEGASVEAFCQAELEAEAASESDDPGPAFEAFIAAAPEDIRGAAEALVAAGQEGAQGPAFSQAYGEVIQYMKDNCGFNEMEVTGADYSFEGVPAELEAGELIITFENTGEELHEVLLYRINDDTTESVQELLAIEDEEALMSKVTQVGGAFAFPGDTSFGTANLEQPGRYLAVCAIPVGLTPEVAEQFPDDPEATVPPDASLPELGPPHHTEGMVAEFTVT